MAKVKPTKPYTCIHGVYKRGVRYSAGGTVDLTDEVAASLLEENAIKLASEGPSKPTDEEA